MRWDRHGLNPSLGKSLLFEVVDILCSGSGSSVPRALRESKLSFHHGAICKP